MLKLILFFVFILLSTATFGQNDYLRKGPIGNAQENKKPEVNTSLIYCGPLPYKRLKETIGETYLVIPLDSGMKKFGYSFIHYKNTPNDDIPAIELEGKLIKLTSIDADNKRGYFNGDDKAEYVAEINSDNTFFNMVLVSEIEAARKLFLNKTLWLNMPGLVTGDPRSRNHGYIDNLRFEPVTIIDIAASTNTDAPVMFIAKSVKGEIGYTSATLSGTNTSLNPSEYFKNTFYTKDPKLTYKFSPAIWANIKKGKVTLGMTQEQVKLTRNTPDRINKVVVGGRAYYDWIYLEPKYQSYLFLNGRVKMIKE